MSRRLESEPVQAPPYTKFIDPSFECIPLEVRSRFIEKSNEKTRRLREGYEDEDHEYNESSKVEIQEAANLALKTTRTTKPTALILGAGYCSDIPLEWLTKKFARTILVDLHEGRLEDAVKRLPEELQAKTRLVTADITGVAGTVVKKLQEAKRTATSTREFYLTSNRVGRDTIVEDQSPDFGDSFTFVSSHLVATQLIQLPNAYYVDTFGKFPPDPIIPNRAYTRMNETLLPRTQRAHIKYLADVTDPDGIIHLAEALNPITSYPLSKLYMKTIDEASNEFFTRIGERRKRKWRYTEKNTYDVFVDTFQPKTSSKAA